MEEVGFREFGREVRGHPDAREGATLGEHLGVVEHGGGGCGGKKGEGEVSWEREDVSSDLDAS